MRHVASLSSVSKTYAKVLMMISSDGWRNKLSNTCCSKRCECSTSDASALATRVVAGSSPGEQIGRGLPTCLHESARREESDKRNDDPHPYCLEGSQNVDFWLPDVWMNEVLVLRVLLKST